MTRFLVAMMLVLVCVEPHAQISPSEVAELSRSDRATLEKQACRKPSNVAAAEISGWRTFIRKPDVVYASVTCAPHLIADKYRSYFKVRCMKYDGSWRCDSRQHVLQTGFLDGGPYDVLVLGLEPDAAVHALRCLETGLRERTDLLGENGSARPEILIARPGDPQRIPRISVSVSTTAKSCLSVSFVRACDANAPVPLEVENDVCGEMDE